MVLADKWLPELKPNAETCTEHRVLPLHLYYSFLLYMRAVAPLLSAGPPGSAILLSSPPTAFPPSTAFPSTLPW